MNKPLAEQESAVKRLNEVLVEEIVRVHRHRTLRARHQRRANLIAERIVELGGAPDYSSLRLALRSREPARS